ncbi:MAG: helix-turn-helix transcriptional regulator [Nitrospira sp.]|jgi:transcriptional regulator with XRE-family HTH domain|nr:helix-turn-helix transcriptional regulator [Nitrospira sp.]
MRKVQDLPVLLAAATAIKARRTEINISQEELAHRADVHRSFVARLELAETQPSLAVFFRLANALEVEVVELTRTIVRRAEQERRSAKKRSAT